MNHQEDRKLNKKFKEYLQAYDLMNLLKVCSLVTWLGHLGEPQFSAHDEAHHWLTKYHASGAPPWQVACPSPAFPNQDLCQLYHDDSK